MHRSHVVHIAPISGAWRVYRQDGAELRLDDLGEAFDAAASLVPEGTAIRIVIHEAAAPASMPHQGEISAAG